MPLAPSTVDSLTPAVIGFLGVILGLLVGVIKEWVMSSSKKKKDLEYLVVRVTTELDKFAEGCAGVAGDDGTVYGQPDDHDCYSPQVEVPELNLHDLDVEWKALPGYLLYEVLNYPNEVDAVKRYLSSAAEFANPPYDDYMEERQYEYAKLGVNANKFASKLRMQAGFPSKDVFKWDCVDYMEQQIKTIEQRTADRERATELRQQIAQHKADSAVSI